MQSEEYPHGWVTEEAWFEERERFIHLVPCNDLRLHQLDPSCWCQPQEDEETPDFYVHNAADRRELFEQGNRKPS